MRYAALLATAVTLLVAAVAPTQAAASHKVLWGTFTPGAPESHSTMNAFNSKMGRKAEIWHTYKNFDKTLFPYDTVGRSHEAGGLPMITLEPFGRSLRAIARGDHDDYLKAGAKQAVDFGKPILLRFAHEMNGNWYPWSVGVNGNSASDYINAWRHVVRVFRNAGANNVKHVWAPNVGSFDNAWPGDEYVDYLGLDGYNWGQKYNTWETFEQVFGDSYRAITRLSRKPVIITEFGVNQAGGDKAAWVRHAFAHSTLAKFPQIRALVYFDEYYDDADWRVSSSGAAESAFRSALNDSVFNLDWRTFLGLGGDDAPPPPADPGPQPDPPADPPADPLGSSGQRCGVFPRSSLRISSQWTINVPIRCRGESACSGLGLVKVKHVGSGRTLGTAQVQLWQNRGTPVRIGLPGWARSGLVARRNLAARVSTRVGSGCRRGSTKRVTLRR
jgi:hypothetical protein